MQQSIDTGDPLGLDEIPDGASLIHVAVERLFGLLKAQMSAALEGCGSSIVEWRILLMLRIHGEMAQKDLVREVAMLQAQVSRSLGVMQRRGLVRARRSTSDRRVWLYRLTPAGSRLYRNIAPTMAARRARLDATLSADDLRMFLDGARKIAAVASAPAGREDVQTEPKIEQGARP